MEHRNGPLHFKPLPCDPKEYWHAIASVQPNAGGPSLEVRLFDYDLKTMLAILLQKVTEELRDFLRHLPSGSTPHLEIHGIGSPRLGASRIMPKDMHQYDYWLRAWQPGSDNGCGSPRFLFIGEHMHPYRPHKGRMEICAEGLRAALESWLQEMEKSGVKTAAKESALRRHEQLLVRSQRP